MPVTFGMASKPMSITGTGDGSTWGRIVAAANPAKTAELVGAVYEAALDGTRWPAFVDNLRASLRAGLGLLWVHDFSDGADLFDNADHLSAVAGLDSGALSRYADHFSHCNVWIPNARQLAEGSLVVSSSLYPEHRLEHTEFYNDWLRGLDLFHGVGSSIAKQGSRDIKLTFVRSRRAGPFVPAELRMLGHLLPHLRRAIALQGTLRRLQSISASAVASLDCLPLGVVLLSRTGTVLHANRRTHELAASTRALRLSASGAIEAATPAATLLLKRLIDNALCLAAGGLAKETTLRVSGLGGAELHVMAAPLAVPSAPFGEAAPAALFLSDPQGAPQSMVQTLRSTYGMTRAEAELTQALVAGQSLTDYARARGVSINTAKTQLKFAAARAGARRQGDLVRIVLTGLAVLRPWSAPSASPST